MAVNAKFLPAIFNDNPWSSSLRVASYEGSWMLTNDADQFHVEESVHTAIKGATVDNSGSGPYLVIGGEVQEVARVAPFGATKWLGYREPEE